MRAILDTNVIVSALLSSKGAPARLLDGWKRGRFELIVSPLLLAELERALAYPKIGRRISNDEARVALDLIRLEATIRPDPDGPPPVRSRDTADDYLLALAASERAVLVSGDASLHEMRGAIPIRSPAGFLDMVESFERESPWEPEAPEGS